MEIQTCDSQLAHLLSRRIKVHIPEEVTPANLYRFAASTAPDSVRFTLTFSRQHSTSFTV